MKLLKCYLFSILIFFLTGLNGCATIFNAPKVMNYNNFYILNYHYMAEDEMVIIEFAMQDSFYTYSDVVIEDSTERRQGNIKVSILAKYADKKEWSDINNKVRRIANGSYIYSFKSSYFRPNIDQVIYIDTEGEYNIPFAGQIKKQFEPYAPVEIEKIIPNN
jgi:hypothetical protein